MQDADGADPGPGGGSRGTVLLVERESQTRERVAIILQQAGFSVDQAKNGQVALAKLREQKHPLVICEILISKLDGLNLCRTIKGDPELAATRVAIFSWFHSAEEDARRAGADAFIPKPLVDGAMLSVVERLMAPRE